MTEAAGSSDDLWDLRRSIELAVSESLVPPPLPEPDITQRGIRADVAEQIAEMFESIKRLPPIPLIIVNGKVPFGRHFHYYDTTGRMIVYVASDIIGRIPVKRDPVYDPRDLSSMPYSIPVIREDM